MATQKELIEKLIEEISTIKGTSIRNTELEVINKSIDELKQAVSNLEYRLLNPDDGIIVETNKNTWYRREHDKRNETYDEALRQIEIIKIWKDQVQKALFILYSAVVGMIIKVITELFKS